jgi:hypothetical protein
MSKRHAMVSVDRIQQRIMLIRGHRVMLDHDLAELFGVSTKRLNEQVKRNAERFPDDFMFQLTPDEKAEVVANCDHLSKLRFSPVLPNVFTEHGAIMAANVLNSPRAVQASVHVVRAFVQLRQMLATHRELAHKLAELERRVGTHDQAILDIMAAIRELMEQQAIPTPEKPKIGFHTRPKHR